jgi:hypothetical protein
MSEQIKELMEKAGIDVEAVENLGEMPSALKFVHLIIQECMNMCDEEKAEYTKLRKNAWDQEEKEIYAEGAAACDTLKYKMKRNFGVQYEPTN